MNKYNADILGGLQFNWDDLDWTQQSTKDTFYGLLSMLDIPSYQIIIISGCQTSQTGTLGNLSITTTAGYMAINGEICYVPTSTYTITSPYGAKWSIVQTNDGRDKVVDSTLAVVYPYVIRNANIVDKTIPGDSDYSSAVNIYEILKIKLGIYDIIANIPQGNKYKIESNEIFRIKSYYQYYIKGRPLINEGMLIIEENGELVLDY